MRSMQRRSNINWLRVLSLAALAIIAMAAGAPLAQAQSTVGTITQLQGTAKVQRNAGTIAAAANMPVLLHDQISTDPNSSLTIGLVDNSSLQLGPSSTITIDDSVLVNGVGAPSRVGLLGGDLHSVIVGAMRGSTTTFEVHTPNAIGAVRGTDFNTHYDNQSHTQDPSCLHTTRVDVNDGTVQVCNTATPPVCKDIHKGQHTTVRCGIFWVDFGPAAVGALGAVGAVGAGLGAAAGAGAFNGPSSSTK
jgi:hypothetical protein